MDYVEQMWIPKNDDDMMPRKFTYQVLILFVTLWISYSESEMTTLDICESVKEEPCILQCSADNFKTVTFYKSRDGKLNASCGEDACHSEIARYNVSRNSSGTYLYIQQLLRQDEGLWHCKMDRNASKSHYLTVYTLVKNLVFEETPEVVEKKFVLRAEAYCAYPNDVTVDVIPSMEEVNITFDSSINYVKDLDRCEDHEFKIIVMCNIKTTFLGNLAFRINITQNGINRSFISDQTHHIIFSETESVTLTTTDIASIILPYLMVMLTVFIVICVVKKYRQHRGCGIVYRAYILCSNSSNKVEKNKTSLI